MVIDITRFKDRYNTFGYCSIGHRVAITNSGVRILIEDDWKVINTKLFIKLVKIGALRVWV